VEEGEGGLNGKGWKSLVPLRYQPARRRAKGQAMMEPSISPYNWEHHDPSATHQTQPAAISRCPTV
jgi:hypothetical protein